MTSFVGIKGSFLRFSQFYSQVNCLKLPSRDSHLKDATKYKTKVGIDPRSSDNDNGRCKNANQRLSDSVNSYQYSLCTHNLYTPLYQY